MLSDLFIMITSGSADRTLPVLIKTIQLAKTQRYRINLTASFHRFMPSGYYLLEYSVAATVGEPENY